MRRPNEITEPLKIDQQRETWPRQGSLSAIEFSDSRYNSRASNRPATISISTDAGELCFLASYEDLIAIREWSSRAVAALDEHRPDLAGFKTAAE